MEKARQNSNVSQDAPRNNAESEMCVLFALLSDPEARLDILDHARAEWFYRGIHQLIFSAVLDLFVAGSVTGDQIDGVVVLNALEESGALAERGLTRDEARDKLADIYGTVPMSATYKSHLDTIRKCYKQRAIADRGRRLFLLAQQDTPEARKEEAAIIGELESIHSDVLEARFVSAKEYAESFEIPVRRSIPDHRKTGLYEIDRAFDLYNPGTVTLVAGRPGQGKSTLLRQWMLRLGRYEPVRLFALEETPKTAFDKMICYESRVGYIAFCYGQLSQDELSRVAIMYGQVGERQITIYDSQAVGLAHIKIVARKHFSQHGQRGAIFIDHIQLMQRDGRKNDNSALGAVMRGIKLAALETQVPIIVACQLNRTAETHEKPNLGSLRDSGALESDADNVLFVYTPDDGQPERRTIAFGKHRNGPLVMDDAIMMPWCALVPAAQNQGGP